ncbi:MAG: xanthine dehydrogenase family protein molybdopterin-binding subunit [Steroidobacteraceae bacterium]
MTDPRAAARRVAIGADLPRPAVRRLLAGEGRYLDDLSLPRMAHVCFVRSPVARGVIRTIDRTRAAAMPGVIGTFDASDLQGHYTPWAGLVTIMPGFKAPLQHPLAAGIVRWQGEAVVAVVAETRAQAADAAALIVLGIDAQPALTSGAQALGADAISAELGDNLAWRMSIENGDCAAAIAAATTVVTERLVFERQTAASLEPRGIIASFEKAGGRLTLHHSTQIPHAIRHLMAKHLGLSESQVRVIVPDVGGSFGLKGNLFPDEFAVAVLAKILGRPLKFAADRRESFLADGHCRDHVVTVTLAVDEHGGFQALAVDGICAIGPYSVYPKGGGVESLLLTGFAGAPYRIATYKADNKVAYVNKAMLTQTRGVGMPVACSVTEAIVDRAARAMGIDPLELRRRNLLPDDGCPTTGATGNHYTELSLQACLERLAGRMRYATLRVQQSEARERGVHRGIGVAMFVEGTAAAPALYGAGGVPISAQDAVTLRLEPDGHVTCLCGITEQGQGGETAIQQIVAATLDIPLDHVHVVTGDTAATPYGAGTWASRSTSIAGEAALRAAQRLRQILLDVAGAITRQAAEDLELADGGVIVRGNGQPAIALDEIGRVMHFRGHELPQGFERTTVVTEQFSLKDNLFLYNNGASACQVEVDIELGRVRVLDFWIVVDCGRIVNRKLVAEQLRGGVAQGIGAALHEQIRYDARGQLQTHSFAEYGVPRADDLPDIHVEHVETPTRSTGLGAKGAGEAGIIGAAAAVTNAVNDALAPFGVRVTHQPFTPERILRALGRC